MEVPSELKRWEIFVRTTPILLESLFGKTGSHTHTGDIGYWTPRTE